MSMINDHHIDLAINIAARADDLPHLVRVASRFSGYTAQGIAGWLHDSVEDGYATEEELRGLFPDEVVDIVMIVSRRDGETYDDFITRILESGNSGAVDVKIIDLTVNLARAKVDRFSHVPRYEKALNRLRNADF